jgi:hypothetical protein
MGTDITPPDSDITVTRFWGGSKRGVCYQVTNGNGHTIDLTLPDIKSLVLVLVKEVLSETPIPTCPIVSVDDLKKRCLEVIKGKCDTCFGFGLWPDGTAPMGPMDAEDGMPTIACLKCGANKNPIKDKKGRKKE